VLVMGQDRDDEEDAVDHVPRDAHDVAGVLRGEACGVPVELQVTRAAVDHPARAAGGAGAPVALLEQQHREPTQGEVTGDARPGHAPADDADVVRAWRAHAMLTRRSLPRQPAVSSPLRAASGTLR